MRKPKDGRLAFRNRDPSAGVSAAHARQPVAVAPVHCLTPEGTFVEMIAGAQVARRQPPLKIGKLGHFTKTGVCRRSSHSRTLSSSSLPRISSATDDRARETLNRFSRSKARARCCRIIIHRRRSETASVTDATGTIASAGCSTWKLDCIGMVIVAPCGSGQAPEPLVES